MKIIITESQLKLIVENEDKGENLLDFTQFIDFNPNKWDEMFEHLNKKKGGRYDGYYIDGDVNLNNSDVTELKYLVKVEGEFILGDLIDSLPMLEYVGGPLDLSKTPIKSLPMLSYVKLNLYLNDTPIESLPKLEHVGGSLDLYKSKIKSLPKLEHVGGILDLVGTPLSKTTTESPRATSASDKCEPIKPAPPVIKYFT